MGVCSVGVCSVGVCSVGGYSVGVCSVGVVVWVCVVWVCVVWVGIVWVCVGGCVVWVCSVGEMCTVLGEGVCDVRSYLLVVCTAILPPPSLSLPLLPPLLPLSRPFSNPPFLHPSLPPPLPTHSHSCKLFSCNDASSSLITSMIVGSCGPHSSSPLPTLPSSTVLYCRWYRLTCLLRAACSHCRRWLRDRENSS